ncbi:MAG: putative Dipeptidyl peptidase 1 [Streblomastix strix]|uniref:Dipeptidyl peptidase 1 n=1 Tax=Streblomastix strix TaxID=222440 RepID=A0A5J4UU46_9EUKA|nr:MAG: putative Dipeptidyl peptidase 1 [Streblomastix strix]
MLLLSLIIFSGLNFCDTPADCDKSQIIGNWTFQIESPSSEPDLNCMSHGEIAPNTTIHVILEEPNIAKSEKGDIGNWTMVDIEGISIYLGGYHYFALFQYIEDEDEAGKTIYYNYCNQTRGGWQNLDIVKPQNFSCFVATKDINTTQQQQHDQQQSALHRIVRLREDYQQQSSSSKYQQFKTKNQQYIKQSKPIQPVPSDPRQIAQFPDSLDWSNQNSYDFTDPVYNQGQCGSCYAFGALGMLETRFSIQMNKTVDNSLSVQDVVSCSHYTQGCDGGYGLEVSQWARDHGIVSSKCFPYQQAQSGLPEISCEFKLCTEQGIQQDRRTYYAENVHYAGGFYGNCSEEAMIRELQNGPIAISIYASLEPFNEYKSGIFDYEYTDIQPSDHLVLLVGYGIYEERNPTTGEKITTPFWKLKNSWGQSWGENGFMRIIRGKNLLNIESEAEVADPYIIPGLYWPDEQSPQDQKKQKAMVAAIISLALVSFVLLMCTIVFGFIAFMKRKSVDDGYAVVGGSGFEFAGGKIQNQ